MSAHTNSNDSNKYRTTLMLYDNFVVIIYKRVDHKCFKSFDYCFYKLRILNIIFLYGYNGMRD